MPKKDQIKGVQKDPRNQKHGQREKRKNRRKFRGGKNELDGYLSKIGSHWKMKGGKEEGKSFGGEKEFR